MKSGAHEDLSAPHCLHICGVALFSIACSTSACSTFLDPFAVSEIGCPNLVPRWLFKLRTSEQPPPYTITPALNYIWNETLNKRKINCQIHIIKCLCQVVSATEERRHSNYESSNNDSPEFGQHRSRSFGWNRRVARVLIIAEAECQVLVVRIIWVIVAARLTIVLALNRRQFLTMFLAAANSPQTLTCYHDVRCKQMKIQIRIDTILAFYNARSIRLAISGQQQRTFKRYFLAFHCLWRKLPNWPRLSGQFNTSEHWPPYPSHYLSPIQT